MNDKQPRPLTVEWILQATDMSLHALALRYTTSKGVGVMLCPGGMADPFQVIDMQTDGGDNCQIMESVFSYTDWFPYATGKTVEAAIRAIDVKLAKIPQSKKHEWVLYTQDLVNHFVKLDLANRRKIQVVANWSEFPADDDSGQPWK